MRAVQIVVSILIAAAFAFGQEASRVEFFAGYSLLNAAALQRHFFSGGQLNIKFNVRPAAAIVVDAGGQYRSDPNRPAPQGLFFLNLHDRYLHAYELAIGPEFTRRRSESDVFVHTLAGIVHGVARENAENFVAAGLGAGFVFHRQKLFGLRVQFDYLPNRGGGRTYHDLRLGTGIVLRKK